MEKTTRRVETCTLTSVESTTSSDKRENTTRNPPDPCEKMGGWIIAKVLVVCEATSKLEPLMERLLLPTRILVGKTNNEEQAVGKTEAWSCQVLINKSEVGKQETAGIPTALRNGRVAETDLCENEKAF